MGCVRTNGCDWETIVGGAMEEGAIYGEEEFIVGKDLALSCKEVQVRGIKDIGGDWDKHTWVAEEDKCIMSFCPSIVDVPRVIGIE